MGQNNVLQPKSKSRSNKKEIIRISAATYIEPFVLKKFFSNDEQRVIDFRPAFNKLKGYYIKWNNPSSFKKFIIKNGELYWGNNGDIQFHPIDIYYNSLLHPFHDELTEDLITV